MIEKNKIRKFAQRSQIKQPRKGIAVIVALIFMMAMLTISTTVASTATNMATSTGGSYKSNQAFYNAETAMERALYNYKHPNAGALSGVPGEDEEENGKMQWKVLGVGSNEGLVNAISDGDDEWSSYPFPGSGTAGKDCDAYNAVTDDKTFISSLTKYVPETSGAGSGDRSELEKAISASYGKPQDHPCNWNKLKDTDSAIEIPLYGIDDNGVRQQIDFSDFKIRVRTACDSKKISGTSGNEDDETRSSWESLIYNGANMCEPGKRYGMYETSVANTIVNWGLYTEVDGSYMVPVKDTKDVETTNDSNITTSKISGGENAGDFVALDINSPNKVGKLKIGKGIEQLKQLSIALSSPPTGIPMPYLRLTVEFPFPNKHYFVAGDGDTSIPNLEYQILYKTNGDASMGTNQISGVPVIIGEGYSGGFRHMIKANIYETPTGFDYIYQKP